MQAIHYKFRGEKEWRQYPTEGMLVDATQFLCDIAKTFRLKYCKLTVQPESKNSEQEEVQKPLHAVTFHRDHNQTSYPRRKDGEEPVLLKTSTTYILKRLPEREPKHIVVYCQQTSEDDADVVMS